jgi:uncharacterized repeat protein (TIGR03847 family)
VRAEQYDYDRVDSINAEAVGPPGQRRFRLTAVAGERSASLWLEKEQLAALGTAIEQQLVRSNRQQRRVEPSPDDEPPPFPLNPTLDAQVTQLSLGFDDTRSLFLFQAAVVDPEQRRQAAFSCLADLRQSRRLTRVIARLMTAGRPTCPLCGAVIEGVHNCPRSNGHTDVAIV